MMLSGDYHIVDKDGRVAIDTLTSSPESFLFPGVFTCGSHKTENLGVERIVINLVANPNVRAIVICGKESFGHYAGQALLSLWMNGVDELGRIVGAKGPIPYLENIDESVVSRFREQILFIEDMIGCTDPELVASRVRDVLSRNMPVFEKAPLLADGMGKKKSGAVPVACAEKLTFSDGVAIDPVTFRVEMNGA